MTEKTEKEKSPDAADWKRMRFRRNKVWVALDAAGGLIEVRGKVLIKYQLDQSHRYWVHSDSVHELEEGRKTTAAAESAKRRRRRPPAKRTRPPEKDSGDTDADTLTMFTDGASSGNPGPAGIGVLLRYREHEKEISRYIGRATNNVAELKAILEGLKAVRDKDLPVRVFTDSNYAYGLLVLGWKARTNVALVETVRREMQRFSDLQIRKIRGHSGNTGNERADRLATGAIKKARS